MKKLILILAISLILWFALGLFIAYQTGKKYHKNINFKKLIVEESFTSLEDFENNNDYKMCIIDNWGLKDTSGRYNYSFVCYEK